MVPHRKLKTTLLGMSNPTFSINRFITVLFSFIHYTTHMKDKQLNIIN